MLPLCESTIAVMIDIATVVDPEIKKRRGPKFFGGIGFSNEQV